MFRRINLIIQNVILVEPVNRNINQNIKNMLTIIEEHDISIGWLFIEAIVYLLYNLMITSYEYAIWSLGKPIYTIQHIQKVCSSIHYNIYPREYRCYMYRELFKTLIIDISRAIVMFYIYYKIQRMLLWK